jgi:hypothetical protein
MRRILISSVLAFTLASPFFGSRVHAAPAVCARYYLCVFTAGNYDVNFPMSFFRYSNHAWSSTTQTAAINNDRSWFNNGTANVCVYHGDWGVVGSHFLTVPLSSGTGYVTSNWWPGPLPNGILGESNKWIGSDPCSAHP